MLSINALRLGILCGLFALLIVFAPNSEADDHAMDSEHGSLPINPDFAEKYKRNAVEIAELQRSVRDTQRTEDERIADYRKLRSKYPDYALHLATDLIKDGSNKIAEFSVSMLGAAVVMSDHKMAHATSISPAEVYAMQRHEFGLKALRVAQLDARPSVRDRATQTLASLSDEIGLQNIIQGAKDGRYSEIDAVNHLGLAKSEVGLALIQPYLGSQAADVQTAAVRYMASSPAFRTVIRDRVLLNDKAPLEARLAASEALSSEASIAMLLLSNGQTPPELFQKTMLTYLNSHGKTYSEAELNALKATVETYQKLEPKANFSELKTEFAKLKQSITP